MIITIITLLIYLCVLALVVYLIIWVLGVIGVPLPPKVIQILWVIVALDRALVHRAGVARWWHAAPRQAH